MPRTWRGQDSQPPVRRRTLRTAPFVSLYARSVSEVVEVPSTGGVLIVASDGLWDGITTTEAANMVRQMIAGPRDMVPEKVAEVRP